MKKIYISENDNMVSQIIPLSEQPNATNEWFPGTYVVDVDDDCDIYYNMRYDTESKKFEINPDYVEPIVTVLPSVFDELFLNKDILEQLIKTQ